MTFGGHVRMAGAVVAIIGALTSMTILSLLGVMFMAVGAVWQIDGLERRVDALEKKGVEDEEA